MPIKRFVLAAALVTTAVVARAQDASLSPSGLWNAVVVVNNVEIPFRFEIGSTGSQVTGAFFDGEVRVPSTAGTFQDGTLTLHFDQYGSRLEAAFSGGALVVADFADEVPALERLREHLACCKARVVGTVLSSL